MQSDSGGLVTGFGAMRDAGLLINGGFFCLRPEIFDYMQDGDELVEAPFQRLSARRQLAVFRYAGFWQAMDTFKDKMAFDSMDAPRRMSLDAVEAGRDSQEQRCAHDPSCRRTAPVAAQCHRLELARPTS